MLEANPERAMTGGIAAERLRRQRSGVFAIGIPRAILNSGVDPEVARILAQSEEMFAGAGVRIREVRMPSPQESVATYYLIATAEASWRVEIPPRQTILSSHLAIPSLSAPKYHR